MSLRIRRGTEAQRTGVTFDLGELVVTTDEFKLFVGDGVTAGGRNIAQNLAGQGLTFNVTTGKLDTAVITLTTDDIAEGSGIDKQYFTTERAQDAVWAALNAGNPYNSAIQFSYDDFNNRITAAVTLDGVGITAVEDDVAPVLGGNLGLNGNDITGTGNINIVGDITADGNLLVSGLGADLGLNGWDITGTGSLIINGSVDLSNGKFNVTGNTITTTDLVTPGNTSNGAANDHLLYVGTLTKPSTVWLSSEKNFIVQTGLVSPDNDGTAVYFRTSRGTLAAPSILTPGDRIAKNVAQGWDGEKYWHAGGYGIGTDPAETITVDMVPGRFEAQTRGPDGLHSMFYTSRGVLTGAVVQPTSFDTVAARDSALPAGVRAAGMMCFVVDSDGSGTPAFMGYNGTTWVTLG